jgi:hypothetical protein
MTKTADSRQDLMVALAMMFVTGMKQQVGTPLDAHIANAEKQHACP